ncbi:Probable histone-lysine N-methyltransferase Mes-4 [Eumeta japonica]|uniref:Probable histone-lysine N-methyltransferase Mes-4 n=1 Tax=Eumeta variegata TaxID=151549 RepID=A0A4C1SXJ0_EUMVA|nr:Probable histone-lysine N-methyltransferase Mes-4 [Eumeta japonica]
MNSEQLLPAIRVPKYYHLECLEHWPQAHFNSGEPSKNNKKISEHYETLTCPRHVCHTCVSDDPRGCKTRFSGDKLAKCVRCPAVYHSLTKCLPAGSLVLNASNIVCTRHREGCSISVNLFESIFNSLDRDSQWKNRFKGQRFGKVPSHVNTSWCFLCAEGGSLICCEYCPTSFHPECLKFKPPEGGYMCEDCETGRLPLYGEMVWAKLGHFRWWPGIILHPSEVPEKIMLKKHCTPGEFVVRFFGQYDHYWMNRGRVFRFQEGDSGRISSQKSKIDDNFMVAVEHAKRAIEVLKDVQPNEEEEMEIQASVLPPSYVKLKVNKPIVGAVRSKVDMYEASSMTQCECDPNDFEPCGPESQCLNRQDKIILHDNARTDAAVPVKNYLKTHNWEVLPHPPYSPDIALSDYHLFLSMADALSEQWFISYEDTKNWVDSWIASKDKEFFRLVV